MRIAKRVLALCVVLVMALALIACSPDDSKPTDTAPGTDTATGSDSTDTSTPPDDGVVFELPPRPTSETADKTFIIIQHSAPEDPFGYTLDTQNADLALARLEDVQELYGCTIELEQVKYDNNFASTMQQRLFAENGGDLVFSTNNAQLRKTLGKGPDDSLMVDLLTVDHIINFWNMEKWGNITSRETMMSGGHFYGVSPALWIDCTPLPFYIIAYDKETLQRFDAQDLQEYWEAGEWNRENMLDSITKCLDTSGGEPVWGMTAHLSHMCRATILSTGVQMVQINKINADETVDWSYGLDSPDVEEALLWLRNTLAACKPYFNNGAESISNAWDAHLDLIDKRAAMCVTRPQTLFQSIVTQCENFGIITWPSADDNVLTGYYENCYSVSIPLFAQNAEWSAFLMYDLFDGIGDIETYDDVIAYYRERYFESDLDVAFLLRDGAVLQYSYWPNQGDSWLGNFTNGINTTTGIPTIVAKAKTDLVSVAEEYILPNKVALEAWRQAGKID